MHDEKQITLGSVMRLFLNLFLGSGWGLISRLTRLHLKEIFVKFSTATGERAIFGQTPSQKMSDAKASHYCVPFFS
ncbi:MAG TPA: hypothetical protein VGC66_21495 [Pyrinomonadaceae bacterium]